MISHPNVKLNLGLDVLRKREDGYHDIDTVFIPFPGISDTLEIVHGDAWNETLAHIRSAYSPEETAQSITPDGKVMITIAKRGGVGWDPLKDLTVKACGEMDRILPKGLPPVKIVLEKTSPVGAGLGGGSSDGAFALRMLRDLFAPEVTDGTLAELAGRLGSDCPFFVHNRPMHGMGRGEILSPVPDPVPDGYEIRVITPEGIAVSTAEAYAGILPSLPERPIMDIIRDDIRSWRGVLKNDFETTVFRKYPELKGIKEKLYAEGAVYASMTGSGSSVFGIFEKK